MITVSDLPALNASLNATSAIFLGAGYCFIRRKQIVLHRTCMLSAFVVSALFLASYLTYHSLHPGVTRFVGPAAARAVYLTILTSHSILAVVVVPLALVTLYRALRGRFDRHRQIARWTWLIWLYVSITGVVVYAMLYRLYPPPR